jgi:hypothetical protein
VSGTRSANITRSVTEEVRLLFEPELSRGEIERAVRDAADDLRGSVSSESLPEMAMKLAVVRLDRIARSSELAGARRDVGL